jgi:galactose mutarotase-like enzyme
MNYNFTNSNSSLTYHPELGWLISWLVIDGQEILYCDKTSLTSWSIRWWIPTLLPNPWAGDWVLPRHGIARNATFVAQEHNNNLTLTLDRNQSTITSEQYSLFPYDFIYDLNYEFINHGCVITQQVTNPKTLSTSNSFSNSLPVGRFPLYPQGAPRSGEMQEQQTLKIGFGLHPYFPAPLSIQQMIWWVTQDLTISHCHDDTQVIQNLGTIILTYPHYQLTIECSSIYPWIRIWTPPWHHAICIEPVTHDVGQYFTNPIIIPSWEPMTGTVKIKIETLH